MFTNLHCSQMTFYTFYMFYTAIHSTPLRYTLYTAHFQHRVQGAFPLFHSSFSNWYSRLVSMHCQKPSWR